MLKTTGFAQVWHTTEANSPSSAFKLTMQSTSAVAAPLPWGTSGLFLFEFEVESASGSNYRFRELVQARLPIFLTEAMFSWDASPSPEALFSVAETLAFLGVCFGLGAFFFVFFLFLPYLCTDAHFVPCLDGIIFSFQNVAIF